MGGTELSLTDSVLEEGMHEKSKIKHTYPSPPYKEISYPLMYREDLVLMNEGSLTLESDIYHFYTEQLQSCHWKQAIRLALFCLKLTD